MSRKFLKDPNRSPLRPHHRAPSYHKLPHTQTAKKPQDASKTPQDPSKTVQDAFKTAQDEPKTLQEAFKSRQDRQNDPKMIPQALPS